MFCPYCGAQTKDGARFCENCGAQLETAPARNEDGFYGYDDGTPRLAPGYSRKLEDKRVLAALKKQGKAVGISAVVLVALPLIGFTLYGAVSDKMSLSQGIFFGLVISLIFGLTTLVTMLKKKLTKPFEGTVANKKKVRRLRRSSRRGGYSRTRWLVWIDCEDGKRRKKEVYPSVFEYLAIGDRVRFLPQFPNPFEKYDKSRDTEIPCMFCSRMNPVANDDCRFCHNPLIK